MLDIGNLSHVAQYEIDDLAAAGITLTPAEIVRLNALCHESTHPDASAVSYTGTPVRLPATHNRYLWPYTIAAAEWYQWACDTLPDEHKIFALVYALEYGRTAGAFDQLWQKDTAIKSVKKYRRGLRCTLGELIVAVGQIINEGGEIPDDPPDATVGNHDQMLVQLVAMTGVPADEWRYRASLKYCIAQITACRTLAEAGGHNTTDAKIEAERRIGQYLKKIRESRDGK